MTMTLAQLSAHEEIRQTIYRHFRAGDRLDADLDREACWDDAVFIGGPLDLPMSEAISLIYDNMLERYFTVTDHYMANIIIDLHGDTAAAEVYAIAYHVLPTDPEALAAVLGKAKLEELGDAARQTHELSLGIRYAMQLEQRGELWKIAAQKLIIDWSKLAPYTGIDGGVYDFLTLRGTRDRNDPSYEWLSSSRPK